MRFFIPRLKVESQWLAISFWWIYFAGWTYYYIDLNSFLGRSYNGIFILKYNVIYNFKLSEAGIKPGTFSSKPIALTTHRLEIRYRVLLYINRNCITWCFEKCLSVDIPQHCVLGKQPASPNLRQTCIISESRSLSRQDGNLERECFDRPSDLH